MPRIQSPENSTARSSRSHVQTPQEPAGRKQRVVLAVRPPNRGVVRDAAIKPFLGRPQEGQPREVLDLGRILWWHGARRCSAIQFAAPAPEPGHLVVTVYTKELIECILLADEASPVGNDHAQTTVRTCRSIGALLPHLGSGTSVVCSFHNYKVVHCTCKTLRVHGHSRETDRSARVEPQPKRRHPEISWGDREVDGVRGKVGYGERRRYRCGDGREHVGRTQAQVIVVVVCAGGACSAAFAEPHPAGGAEAGEAKGGGREEGTGVGQRCAARIGR